MSEGHSDNVASRAHTLSRARALSLLLSLSVFAPSLSHADDPLVWQDTVVGHVPEADEHTPTTSRSRSTQTDVSAFDEEDKCALARGLRRLASRCFGVCLRLRLRLRLCE